MKPRWRIDEDETKMNKNKKEKYEQQFTKKILRRKRSR